VWVRSSDSTGVTYTANERFIHEITSEIAMAGASGGASEVLGMFVHKSDMPSVLELKSVLHATMEAEKGVDYSLKSWRLSRQTCTTSIRCFNQMEGCFLPLKLHAVRGATTSGEEVWTVFEFVPIESSGDLKLKRSGSSRLGSAMAAAAVALCDAAARGDLMKVTLLVEDGIDVNTGDYDQRTALHLAASEGQLDVVKFIAECDDAKLSPVDRWGGTPVDDAMRCGHSDVAEFLIKQGALKGRMSQARPLGATELCDAVARGDETELKRLVLQEKVDVNACDYDRRSALHLAAVEGKLQLVKCLIDELRASPVLADRWGFRPLDDAMRGQHFEVTDFLMHIPEVREDLKTREPITNGAASRAVKLPGSAADDYDQDLDLDRFSMVEEEEEKEEGLQEGKENASSSQAAASLRNQLATRVGTPIPLTVDYSQLTIGRKLGRGGFGSVFLATWRHDDVAVKMTNVMGDSFENAVFLRELSLLVSLHHKHVIQLYGGGVSPWPFMITEYFERGSLDDGLYSGDASVRAQYAWQRHGGKLMLDAAKGLRYLHNLEPPIIHFDIKPANVFVTATFVGKLGDVGAALSRDGQGTKAEVITELYAAPEVRRDEGADVSSDVYSLGVMMLEVFTGQPPPEPDKRPFQVEKRWPIAHLLKVITGRSTRGALCSSPAKRPGIANLVSDLTVVLATG